jgi:hypothetical protein
LRKNSHLKETDRWGWALFKLSTSKFRTSIEQTIPPRWRYTLHLSRQYILNAKKRFQLIFKTSLELPALKNSYITLYNSLLTLQRELPASQRRYLHVYYFWVKYGFVATLYRQHSIPYQLIRDPPRLQFWLRTLAPITPIFGGLKLVEHNTRYTLFCNLIALLRGAVVLSLIWLMVVLGCSCGDSGELYH